MPDISVGAQVFDLCFHPTSSLLYTGLLTGDVKALAYDDQGNHEAKFNLRPSKRSCRALCLSEDGSTLWAGGKSKAIYAIDTTTGVVVETKNGAHDSPINRMRKLTQHTLVSGDDDGVIKLWDNRKPDGAIRAYTHHFDFISDFLYLDNKKHLVSTSGDGTLSVVDIRSKKTEPYAQSEDQEDELLSVASIRGGNKFVVGTQIGILSVFNKSSGWGDCVDRIPGHPSSIDTLCNLPSRYPSAHSTLLTGSSDGLVRAVQLFPTKLLGIVADHGEFPVERVVVDQAGEGEWVASVGHEEGVKLTHLREVFEDENEDEQDEDQDQGQSDQDEEHSDGDDHQVAAAPSPKHLVTVDMTGVGEGNVDTDGKQDTDDEEDADSSDEDEVEVERTRKRKQKEHDPLTAGRRKKGRNEIDADGAFFADL
ncbi:WD40 repeat-like protein [Punctularia strigosozonata HHB-11173 SS5]|uniref:WD40 repeat-like protein n=1 Tax=Punctularia strigosozonata (strain HHB-11173) TaxID=741275 RepID=UPI0004416C71|nr:WD40 repeat-like protein [Punctularia strigosozonata HHB-11173 SS5]EIN14495.1 WD40 repeat-like protein [Punctularia strigosozonata HHB-11173 SS5]